jgi:anti-sigma factor RsiW
MSTNPHPRAQLSAYLDDALSAVERSAVEAHLDVCADCRARLTELRATVSLIRSLPDPIPSRRLVPRVGAVPMWLAPLRTLTTLGSGVFAFMFIASALLANVGTLATSTAGAPAAAPAAGGVGTTSERRDAAATASGAPAPGALASSADAKAAAPGTAGPTGPLGQQFSTASAPPQDATRNLNDEAARAREAQAQRVTPISPQLGPSPWLWLALALALGAVAIALQRRLRSA